MSRHRSKDWSDLSDRERIERLRWWYEQARKRRNQLELELVEWEDRLRMLFRELGAFERRLRPLEHLPEVEGLPLVDDLLEAVLNAQANDES